MFGLIPLFLSSIACFLFPIFASYKALKTSDPAQLTPWLMYWTVFACGLLVESWVDWFLVWVPFYGYVRLLFLLYLVLPQTQGARLIYESHVHPFLEQYEGQIEDFIAEAHERLKAAGLSYLKRAIDFVKTNVFGMPPGEPEPERPPPPTSAQSYTQSLLARFSVPAARWAAGSDAGSPHSGADFYNFLAGAVVAATTAAAQKRDSPASATSSGTAASAGGLSSLIPSNLTGAGEKMSFIAAQRERLNAVLGALDREAQALQREETLRAQNSDRHPRAGSWNFDGSQSGGGGGGGGGGEESVHRRASGGSSGFGFGNWNRNKSESEFETIEAESGAEEDLHDDYPGAGVRRRPAPPVSSASGSGGSWVPWGGWGGATPTGHDGPGQGGASSGMDRSR